MNKNQFMIDSKIVTVDELARMAGKEFLKIGHRFDEVDRRFDEVDERFDTLESEMREGFKEMREGFKRTNSLTPSSYKK